MKPINEILQIPISAYEMIRFTMWQRWTESHATNPKEWQLILANSQINKWYNLEYQKCENEFVKLTRRYQGSPTVRPEDISRCYNDCVLKMFSLFPQPLLEEAKHRETVDTIQVAGIKIQTQLFNLN